MFRLVRKHKTDERIMAWSLKLCKEGDYGICPPHLDANVAINERKIIYELLTKCKAVPFSEPTEGWRFYKVMTQQFKLPSVEVSTR